MAVPVAQAEDVAEDADGGGGARVCEALVEPVVRGHVFFLEEVAEHGVELFADLSEDLDAVVRAGALSVVDVLSTGVWFEILGEVSLVRGQEVVVERNGVLDEFDDSSHGSQG